MLNGTRCKLKNVQLQQYNIRFSPVWVLMCVFRLLGRLNALPQYVHSYLAGVCANLSSCGEVAWDLGGKKKGKAGEKT
jgi:hypothetical protein